VQVASYAAAIGGPAAPFLASLVFLFAGACIVALTWAENRGGGGGAGPKDTGGEETTGDSTAGGGGLGDGLKAMMRSPALLALAMVQVCLCVCAFRTG